MNPAGERTGHIPRAPFCSEGSVLLYLQRKYWGNGRDSTRHLSSVNSVRSAGGLWPDEAQLSAGNLLLQYTLALGFSLYVYRLRVQTGQWPPPHLIFFWNGFIFHYTYMRVSMCGNTHRNAGAHRGQRGRWICWSWKSRRPWAAHVGAVTHTRVSDKSSECSQLLRGLSSPCSEKLKLVFKAWRFPKGRLILSLKLNSDQSLTCGEMNMMCLGRHRNPCAQSLLVQTA